MTTDRQGTQEWNSNARGTGSTDEPIALRISREHLRLVPPKLVFLERLPKQGSNIHAR